MLKRVRIDESRICFWPLTATSGTRICRLYRDTWFRVWGLGSKVLGLRVSGEGEEGQGGRWGRRERERVKEVEEVAGESRGSVQRVRGGRGGRGGWEGSGRWTRQQEGKGQICVEVAGRPPTDLGLAKRTHKSGGIGSMSAQRGVSDAHVLHDKGEEEKSAQCVEADPQQSAGKKEKTRRNSREIRASVESMTGFKGISFITPCQISLPLPLPPSFSRGTTYRSEVQNDRCDGVTCCLG